MGEKQNTIKTLYPIQLDFSSDKKRVLYYNSEAEQIESLQALHNLQGFQTQRAQYEILGKIGQGGFSDVMLAKHRSSGE